MNPYICLTCGSQFAATAKPPERCPICEDERQYVGHDGQRWTTLEELRQRHRNRVEEQEAGLYGVGTEPSFAIGQRALLIQSPQGNVLWDCVSLLDEATVAEVNRLGGVSAIAVSHPHYYASVVEWARVFGATVYLHAADRQWTMRPDPAIHYWDGESLELQDGVTLIRAGGHFAGGTVCHWAAGAGGAGALLTGDIIQVVADKRWVSFMYSYPNLIPLSAAKVEQVAASVEPYAFERVYGAWWDAVVASGAKESVRRSAERYTRALEETVALS